MDGVRAKASFSMLDIKVNIKINLILTRNRANALNIPKNEYLYHGRLVAWTLFEPHQREGIFKRAMLAFLNNSSNTDDYCRQPWDLKEVVQSWMRIKESDGLLFLKEEIANAWIHVRGGGFVGVFCAKDSWATFSANIWSFCLAAGCPKADKSNPFKSLEMLRDSISRQFLYTADLHQRISDLNKQSILQQRMITALAYRNILENLSANTLGNSEAQRWRTFLEEMFSAVEKGDIPRENPFTNLFEQHDLEKKYSLPHLKSMAHELYSTLSRTIHNFQSSKDFDQYTPMPGQFDPMQIDFMAAMKPLTENLNRDGNPIWEQERARYPGQGVKWSHTIQSKSTTKPEKQTKNETEAATPESVEDGIVFPLHPDLGDLDSEE